jgi:hypothetical protein
MLPDCPQDVQEAAGELDGAGHGPAGYPGNSILMGRRVAHGREQAGARNTAECETARRDLLPLSRSKKPFEEVIQIILRSDFCRPKRRIWGVAYGSVNCITTNAVPRFSLTDISVNSTRSSVHANIPAGPLAEATEVKHSYVAIAKCNPWSLDTEE